MPKPQEAWSHAGDDGGGFEGFAAHGLGVCADKICEHLGIESAEDIKLVTARDLEGTKFRLWVEGSLTIVQYKKALKAFS